MAFRVEIKDKDGKVIDWQRIDREVCELWGVEKNPDDWATPPGKHPDDNWNEFLGYGIMFLRGFHEDKDTFVPSDLLRGWGTFGDLSANIGSIIEYKYEIQLILDWTAKGYTIHLLNDL